MPYIACRSLVCGVGPSPHVSLGRSEWKFVPGELHREVLYAVREDGYCTALGLWQRGLGFPFCFRGSETLERFSGDRCHLAPASQGMQRVLVGRVQLEIFLFFYADIRDWQELMVVGSLC